MAFFWYYRLLHWDEYKEHVKLAIRVPRLKLSIWGSDVCSLLAHPTHQQQWIKLQHNFNTHLSTHSFTYISLPLCVNIFLLTVLTHSPLPCGGQPF
jgi:hypothetical protein